MTNNYLRVRDRLVFFDDTCVRSRQLAWTRALAYLADARTRADVGRDVCVWRGSGRERVEGTYVPVVDEKLTPIPLNVRVIGVSPPAAPLQEAS
jgi:hypothetical protein